jgi:probable HAF family extracellular repeat protein
MKKFNLKKYLGGFSALLAMSGSCFAAGWQLTDLGAFESGTSGGYALTADGRVGGLSARANGLPYPFLSQNGQLAPIGNTTGVVLVANKNGLAAGRITSADGLRIELGIFSGNNTIPLGGFGGGYVEINGINENGQVVGYGVFPNYNEHAFVATTAGLVDLGTLGGRFSRAVGINNAGAIVASASNAKGQTRCALSYGGGLTDIGSLSATGSCVPTAINSSGMIVGMSNNGQATHAFLYDGRQFYDLGTLGGNTSTATAINDLGQVVGNASIANGDNRAFLYSAGSMLNLGMPAGAAGNSYARAINNKGQVIGYYTLNSDPNKTRRAFLYSNGVIADVSSLASGLADIDYTTLRINDAGQLAGTGKINGVQRAFLLTPLP